MTWFLLQLHGNIDINNVTTNDLLATNDLLEEARKSENLPLCVKPIA